MVPATLHVELVTCLPQSKRHVTDRYAPDGSKTGTITLHSGGASLIAVAIAATTDPLSCGSIRSVWKSTLESGGKPTVGPFAWSIWLSLVVPFTENKLSLAEGLSFRSRASSGEESAVCRQQGKADSSPFSPPGRGYERFGKTTVLWESEECLRKPVLIAVALLRASSGSPLRWRNDPLLRHFSLNLVREIMQWLVVRGGKLAG
jgi:hypothetical protein